MKKSFIKSFLINEGVLIDDRFKPHKDPSVDDKYLVIKTIDKKSSLRGNEIDTHNGMIHGVWHPQQNRVVHFTEEEYFKSIKK